MPGRADCCGERIGTSFEARRWLSLNPCGLAGISCSFSVHVFALWVVGGHLISESFFAQTIYVLVYLPLTFMAVWSLFTAWTTDPGAVPMGARPLVTVTRAASGELSPSVQARKRGVRRCHKCGDNYKPSRAHHDSVTGRCIVKMDHYCPWVCNAIGAMNHKFFVLFIFYTMNTCLTAIFLIVIRSIRCGYEYEVDDKAAANGLVPTSSNTTSSVIEEESGTLQKEEEVGEMDLDRRILHQLARWLGGSDASGEPNFVHPECSDFYGTPFVMILFVVAILFLIFTGCMLVEQFSAITTNQGKIARMKMSIGQGGTELSRVTEEFNEMFGGTSPNVAWHWFVPLPVQFPGSLKKVQLGYEWDETFDAVPYQDGTDDGGNASSTTSTCDMGDGSGGLTKKTSEEAEPPDVEAGFEDEDGEMDDVTLQDDEKSTSSAGGRRGIKKRCLKRPSSGSSTSLPQLA